MSMEDICQRDLVLAARLEELAWAHSDGVNEFVPMQEC